MKHKIAFFLMLTAAPLGAQSLTMGGEDSVLTGSVPTAPVSDAPTEAPAAAPDLPLPEQRVRQGLILLTGLHDTMAGIHDEDTATAAVAPLMRLHRALQEWAQSFASLPPLTEQEQRAYEERYLPIFQKLNARIRTQGDRLAAAEYYGSRDLPAALMHLALINQ